MLTALNAADMEVKQGTEWAVFGVDVVIKRVFTSSPGQTGWATVVRRHVWLQLQHLQMTHSHEM